MFRLKSATFNVLQEETVDLNTNDASPVENLVSPSLLEDDRPMPSSSRDMFSNINEFTPRYMDNFLNRQILV